MRKATTLAEKIAVSKNCCQRVKDSIAEKGRELHDKFFDGSWSVFVIKRDEKTGELTGKKVCRAMSPA
jgi:hypothetical protein